MQDFSPNLPGEHFTFSRAWDKCSLKEGQTGPQVERFTALTQMTQSKNYIKDSALSPWSDS